MSASCFALLLQWLSFHLLWGETQFSQEILASLNAENRGIVLLLNAAHPGRGSLTRIAAREIKKAGPAEIFAVSPATNDDVSEETGERHSASSTYAKSWCRKLALIQIAVAS